MAGGTKLRYISTGGCSFETEILGFIHVFCLRITSMTIRAIQAFLLMNVQLKVQSWSSQFIF
jgi:hypothetical protein